MIQVAASTWRSPFDGSGFLTDLNHLNRIFDFFNTETALRGTP